MEIEIYNSAYLNLNKKKLFAQWLRGEPLIEDCDDSYLHVIGELIGKTVKKVYLRKEVNGDEYIFVITDEESLILGRADNKIDVRQFFGFE